MNIFFILILAFIPLSIISGKEFVVPDSPNRHLRTVNFARESSYPYITGDTFRLSCDFVIDEMKIPFDPGKVKKGDTIFLNADYMEFFFSTIHPLIQSPYILVTHNSDRRITKKYLKYLDDPLLAAWFAQNVYTAHPKLVPIPIGLGNKYWKHGNVNYIGLLIKRIENYQKKHLLYMNFSLDSNILERSLVYNQFKNESYCNVAQKVSQEQYLEDVICSKFILSPEGCGPDCHRTWEALLMGSYPIVKHTPMDKLFEGLPVVIVDDWKVVTKEFLEKKYDEMSQTSYHLESLYIDYWLKKIQDTKNRIKG